MLRVWVRGGLRLGQTMIEGGGAPYIGIWRHIEELSTIGRGVEYHKKIDGDPLESGVVQEGEV